MPSPHGPTTGLLQQLAAPPPTPQPLVQSQPGRGPEPGSRAPIGREEPGRYRLLRELARGGQGVVHVAWDAHLGREVAFKQLLGTPERLGADGSLTPAEARFVREARITAQLDHPGIAPVHEVGRRDDGSLFVTQKLVRGRTLAEALGACATLRDRLGLLQPFLGVCQAVAFAHGRGVIHRDLKPGNVLLGDLGEAVVLDWGLGRTSDEPASPADATPPVDSLLESEAGRTRDGAVMGTPAYMSPEQALGNGALVDARADVWSLGVILYELLTGQRPFAGDTSRAVMLAVATAAVRPVRAACPEAPAELAAVAERALQREPARRYASAKELAAELAAWLSGGRVVAHEYSSWELARKFVARNRALVAMGAALLALALASGGALLVRYRAQERLLAAALMERARAAAAELRWDEAAIYAAGARLHDDTAEARWTAAQAGPLGLRLVAQWGGSTVTGRARLTSNGSRFLVPNFSGLGAAEAATGRYTQLVAGLVRHPVALSDDDAAASGADSEGNLSVWNVADGSVRWTLPSRSAPDQPAAAWGRSAAAFSPDGGTLALDAADGTALLLDARTGAPRGRLGAPGKALSSVRFSKDGRSLVTAGAEVAVWDVPSLSLRQRLALEAASAWLLPDGQLAWASDKGAGTRDPAGRDPAWTAWTTPQRTIDCAGSPLVAAAADEESVLWSFSLRRPLARLRGWAQSFSADCRTLLLLTPELTFQVWSVGDASWRTLGGPGREARLRGVTARGRLLWDESRDGQVTLRVEDLAGGPALAAAPQPGGTQREVLASADGALLAETFLDPEQGWRVRTRSTADLSVLTTFERGNWAFTADPRLFASFNRKGRLRLFDARTGRLEKELSTGASPGYLDPQPDFSPDGKLVAIPDGNGADLWDLARAAPAGRLESGAPAPLERALFAADGRLVAVDVEGTVSLLSPRRDRPPALLRNRKHGPLALSHDRRTLALGDGGRVRLWDLSQDELLLDLPLAKRLAALALSPDGRTLVSEPADPEVLVTPLRPPAAGLAPAADLRERLGVPTRWLEGTAIVDRPRDLETQGLLPGVVALPVAPLARAANLDFEEGAPGEALPRWRALQGAATVSGERPAAGARCALLESGAPKPGGLPVNAFLMLNFANAGALAVQVVDARPLRGRRVRLAGAARVEGPEGTDARLHLSVERPGGRHAFFSQSDTAPPGPNWSRLEVVGRVAPDAERVVLTLNLRGAGRAWFDDFSFGPVE